MRASLLEELERANREICLLTDNGRRYPRLEYLGVLPSRAPRCYLSRPPGCETDFARRPRRRALDCMLPNGLPAATSADLLVSRISSAPGARVTQAPTGIADAITMRAFGVRCMVGLRQIGTKAAMIAEAAAACKRRFCLRGVPTGHAGMNVGRTPQGSFSVC